MKWNGLCGRCVANVGYGNGFKEEMFSNKESKRSELGQSGLITCVFLFCFLTGGRVSGSHGKDESTGRK